LLGFNDRREWVGEGGALAAGGFVVFYGGVAVGLGRDLRRYGEFARLGLIEKEVV
jgi:hypothetical protein